MRRPGVRAGCIASAGRSVGRVRAGGHAVVAGAGLGGLAAAVALQGAGWDVTVLERAAELAEVGAGVGLWPNAVCAAVDRSGTRAGAARTVGAARPCWPALGWRPLAGAVGRFADGTALRQPDSAARPA